ncbi:MAG TPA: hypothetical protein VIJ22_14095 [Polyangiaceae bacterium]
MAKRTTRVTLSNNTPFDLDLVGSGVLCHGKWTEGGWAPPAKIPGKTGASWQSQSDGFLTGTEGWVKYVIQNTGVDARSGGIPCLNELVYIHWDNPFIYGPDQGNHLIDFGVSTGDVTAPCNASHAVWTAGSADGTVSASQTCRHELFVANVSGSGVQGVSWWDFVVNWPALLALTAVGQGDIDLQFTLGLRQLGSVDETIFTLYDGSQGLRALVNQANQPSLRKLFNFGPP